MVYFSTGKKCSNKGRPQVQTGPTWERGGAREGPADTPGGNAVRSLKEQVRGVLAKRVGKGNLGGRNNMSKGTEVRQNLGLWQL